MSDRFEGLTESQRVELMHRSKVAESLLKFANKPGASSKWRQQMDDDISAIFKITDDFLSAPAQASPAVNGIAMERLLDGCVDS